MHEGSIVKSLFDIASKIKEDEKLIEIQTVKVVIGKFHQIVDEVFLMYFDLMKKEYKGFENAELIMEEKDVIVKCKKCNETFTIEDPIFICPKCESFDTEIIQGNELHIETMEGIQE